MPKKSKQLAVGSERNGGEEGRWSPGPSKERGAGYRYAEGPNLLHFHSAGGLTKPALGGAACLDDGGLIT